MKYLYLVLLLLPLKVLGQVKLQDVTISGKQPKFVRLKGYFRSYQHNDSLLKYYEDGIVEYYINLKNEKVYLRNLTHLFGYNHRSYHHRRRGVLSLCVQLCTQSLFPLFGGESARRG